MHPDRHVGPRNENDTSEPQAVVIGSGFGGAVTACRLAQAGFKVLILERGRRYQQGDYPDLPQDSSLLPDTRRWNWSADQGLWEMLDLEDIATVQAAGYGGGSLVYANVHLRPPASIFDAAWPERDRNRVGLDEYFDLAAYMLDVSPVDAHPRFHGEIVKSAQMRGAARSLGRSVFYPPLAIRYAPDGLNDHGVAQRTCTGCGACCSGCPQKAKNTLDLNYLALAERHGAQVITQCEVVGLVEAGPGEWVVRCFDHLEARKRTFRARHVFLCAGPVHSTRLMAGAQLLRRNRPLKNLVGAGYSPGGGAIGIVYDTAHPQRPSVGPAISTTLVEWSPADPSSFFMLQDGGYPPALDRLVGLLRASAWIDRNKLSEAGHAAVPASESPGLPPLLGEPAVPVVPNRQASPLDDLLRAFESGSFRESVPAQLRGQSKHLADRVRLPLALSAAVATTIRGGLLSRLDSRWLRWLVRGPLRRPLLWVGKRTAAIGLGGEPGFGVRALLALLGRGPLKPAQLAARAVGYDGARGEHRAVFLAMGRDATAGALHYHRETKRLTADLDRARLTPGYSKQATLMTELAQQLGGELRTNPAWEFLRKPITVHNQGGCRMSDAASSGVTDPLGKVHGCEGLYILDGSLLCGSVGVNPSATIMALAERGVLHFIRDHKNPQWPSGDPSPGAAEYALHRSRSIDWAAKAKNAGWDLSPPAPAVPSRSAIAVPSPLPVRQARSASSSPSG